MQTDSHGELQIRSGRVHNGILLLAFEGINDRNAIEELRDVILHADVDINESSVEDDYHVQQLIGCEALLEDGAHLGEIVDVLNLPGQDVLVVKAESKEILIPFVHQLVPKVDIEGKKITVIPPVISGVVDEN
mgnify:FL=1